MSDKTPSFKLATSYDDVAKAMFVRGVVFVEEMRIPYIEEFDGGDSSSMHVLGLLGSEPFAAARIRHVDGGARIERLCVRAPYRGRGLGDQLLSFVVALTEETGSERCSVLAEGMLVQWFRNHGFELARTLTRPDGSECCEMARGASGGGAAVSVEEDREKRLPLGSVQKPEKAADTSPTGPVCALSGARFEITEADRAFYQRLQVPPPKLSPVERARRRMAFANQRNLFVRSCAATGKRIVTNYPPEADVPVYDALFWLSDGWDQYASGRAYDFNRPFFEQFADLAKIAPRPNLQKAADVDENSDYTNYAGENKNCYLIFDSDKNRDCLYSYSINSCLDVVDCFRMEKCELCYECLDCTNCYSSIFLQNCDNCHDSAFLKNCIGCADCFASVNLRNKKYWFMNEELTKKDYEERIKSVRLDKYRTLKALRPQFLEQASQFPRKNVEGVQNESTIGDYLTSCKNAEYCFDSRKLWDCKYIIQGFDSAKDCMDCTEIGSGAELLYECAYAGYNANFNRFCSHTYGNTSNLTYCCYCPLCTDCFGCFGLRRARHCILNKQYTEAEYKALVPRIIKHMQNTGEWGEFFAAYISPFPYNLTHAHEYYPLTKAEAIRRGYRWRDEEKKEYQPASCVLPDDITSVSDDITQALLACEVTGKNYKVQKPELLFYRKMNLPLPRLCPDERHFARLRLRNARVLHKRKCAADGEEVLTTIPPDRAAEVYCEEHFLKLLD